MSLDPPPYLGSLQNNIRQRPIPWDGAARAGTITETQLAKIRAVDKVKREQRKQVVESDLDGYRILFVGEPGAPGVLESASRRSDVIQYILVLLSDLLESMYLLLHRLLALPCPAYFDHALLTSTPLHQVCPPSPKPSSRTPTLINISFLCSPTRTTPKTPSPSSLPPCLPSLWPTPMTNHRPPNAPSR